MIVLLNTTCPWIFWRVKNSCWSGWRNWAIELRFLCMQLLIAFGSVADLWVEIHNRRASELTGNPAEAIENDTMGG